MIKAIRKNRMLVLVVLCASMLTPIKAYAGSYNYASKKWRSEVRYQLKRHHIWSNSKENKILHIVASESGGSQGARNGSCVGLLQFNSSWKHNYSRSWFKKNGIRGAYHSDNRLSGSWAIRRIVMVYKIGGTRYVMQHWSQTY